MRLEPLISFDAEMQTTDIGPTPAGHRMNMELAGKTRAGSRLEGDIAGVDFLTLRSDGAAEVDVYVTLTTPAKQVVAVRANGLATLDSDGRASGYLGVRFETGGDELGWLNRAVGVASTTADMSKGSLSVETLLLQRRPEISEVIGSGRSAAHGHEHLFVLGQPLLEQGQQLSLDLQEAAEHGDGVRRRHRLFVMSGSRKLAAAGQRVAGRP